MRCKRAPHKRTWARARTYGHIPVVNTMIGEKHERRQQLQEQQQPLVFA
jgi:hypothetical protein